MKKNKGFTLIELLAVIVVLAIIALIATPIVMNTIKNSKKGAAESSVDSYIKQVETAVLENRVQTGNTISDGTYDINKDGNICLNTGCTETLAINMNGNKPSSGTITIKNGQVVSASDMIVSGYNVDYTSSDNKYIVTEITEDDNDSILCISDYIVDLNNLLYGDNFTCDLGDGENKIFYLLEDNNDTLSLIMNMNIDENGKATTDGIKVKWISKEDYKNNGGKDLSNTTSCIKTNICAQTDLGSITVSNTLKESTKNWSKLDISQISLPTYDQIYAAAGNKTSDIPTWLYENNSNYYWTSTEHGSIQSYYVSSSGSLDFNYAESSYNIRPVITISKSQIQFQNFDSSILCSAKSFVTNGNLAQGEYNFGDEYNCNLGDRENKTFYVLENNDDTVSLIMNMNIDGEGKGTISGNTVAWSSDGSNANGPVTALAYLESSTTNWTKLDSSQISLPTYDQIYTAAGNKTNNLPKWLYDNLIDNSYWTSTDMSSTLAYNVRSSGLIAFGTISATYGVRPVITIPKTQIR